MSVRTDAHGVSTTARTVASRGWRIHGNRLALRGRAAVAAALAFFAFTAATVYPAPVRAAAAVPCEEQAVYEYYECLIDARDAWNSTLCDLEFLVLYALCYQKDPA